MEYHEHSRQVREGVYDAILREIVVKPSRFTPNQIGWAEYGDRPVAHLDLMFEVLDGSAGPQSRRDWLGYSECWCFEERLLKPFQLSDQEPRCYDRMVQAVEDLLGEPAKGPDGRRYRRITSLPVGYRFRVRVADARQVGGGTACLLCVVGEVLGLSSAVEPAGKG